MAKQDNCLLEWYAITAVWLCTAVYLGLLSDGGGAMVVVSATACDVRARPLQIFKSKIYLYTSSILIIIFNIAGDLRDLWVTCSAWYPWFVPAGQCQLIHLGILHSFTFSRHSRLKLERQPQINTYLIKKRSVTFELYNKLVLDIDTAERPCTLDEFQCFCFQKPSIKHSLNGLSTSPIYLSANSDCKYNMVLIF